MTRAFRTRRLWFGPHKWLFEADGGVIADSAGQDGPNSAPRDAPAHREALATARDLKIDQPAGKHPVTGLEREA